MKPTRCPICHSGDLTHRRLAAHTGVLFRISFFKVVGVAGATCLACGAVIPYLDDAALAKVRAWSTITRPAKAIIDEL